MPLERLLLPSPEWLVAWGLVMFWGAAVASLVWGGYLYLTRKRKIK